MIMEGLKRRPSRICPTPVIWAFGVTDWPFLFWYLSLYSVHREGVSHAEYKQCFGIMENATRCPTGAQRPPVWHQHRYDIINHKLHTHKALMKSRNNLFSMPEGVTKREQHHQRTPLWVHKNVAQSNTESVIATAPKVGNFPADRAMWPHDVIQ